MDPISLKFPSISLKVGKPLFSDFPAVRGLSSSFQNYVPLFSKLLTQDDHSVCPRLDRQAPLPQDSGVTHPGNRGHWELSSIPPTIH